MESYDPPCIELMTPVNVDDKRLKGFSPTLAISVSYATETFQEIANLRDFNVETLWSSAGGFVGIFLGYSLLQVPELLNVNWRVYWNKINLIFRITSFLTLAFGFTSVEGKILSFNMNN